MWSMASRRRNLAEAECRRLNKQLADLREMIGRLGASQLLNRSGFLEAFNDWLEMHHAGAQRGEALVRAALDQFMLETGPCRAAGGGRRGGTGRSVGGGWQE